jgi:hypothetical protein
LSKPGVALHPTIPVDPVFFIIFCRLFNSPLSSFPLFPSVKVSAEKIVSAIRRCNGREATARLSTQPRTLSGRYQEVTNAAF